MSLCASQITSLTIVYSTVYSDADQRKHQSAASLAFVRGIHRGPVNSPHKGPVTRKMFPFDDVIMVTLKSAWTTFHESSKSSYCVNLVVTGGNWGCRHDNHRCHQWWQSWHHNNSWLSVVKWNQVDFYFLSIPVHYVILTRTSWCYRCYLTSWMETVLHINQGYGLYVICQTKGNNSCIHSRYMLCLRVPLWLWITCSDNSLLPPPWNMSNYVV